MKQKITYILVFLFAIQSSIAQQTLSQLLKKHNTKNVPYMSVQELAMPKTQALILDAREPEEYQVSHIKNAVSIGFDNFNVIETQTQIPNKNEQIVVYCSVGIRSEIIGKKLQKAGYNNVYNLYGGIFEWKNKGFAIVNAEENETENVHVFSKVWQKWLTSGIPVFN